MKQEPEACVFLPFFSFSIDIMMMVVGVEQCYRKQAHTEYQNSNLTLCHTQTKKEKKYSKMSGAPRYEYSDKSQKFFCFVF